MDWKRWAVIVVFSPVLASVALGLFIGMLLVYAASGKWELKEAWDDLRRKV